MAKSKKYTSTEEYKWIFAKLKAKCSQQNWDFYYMHGSKRTQGVAYAIDEPNDSAVRMVRLADSSSIFTTESKVLLNATNLCKNARGKQLICTDSLSVIKEMQNVNHKNATICSIRETLIIINNNNIILLAQTPEIEKGLGRFFKLWNV